ncbi:MAG: imidazole glycerol phosphate synthase subunit HisF [Sphaerochaetaceae bacterium]|jgi:cyclase|nr:imidazole glycerol phosphate synthase subunit HisF [Sphaerochaetaceae bacterium]MDC7248598.1 imidazole glycerol phosphate synthase subunit HisF [Sphaerochaetaceae bacterium]
MLAKRIIPCLDVKDGRTVKGVNFIDLIDAGDASELAKLYSDLGADELVFLDITATVEKRATLAKLVKKVASTINIPFTVGGGINTIEDVEVLLSSGADKISINSSAFKDPNLISNLANNFGTQCVVCALDVKKDSRFKSGYQCYIHGGRIETNRDALEIAKEFTDKGAGEILLTSMDKDGTKDGFALDLNAMISQSVTIPVIASGGAGKCEHFYDVFTQGKADAALAASIFHFGEISIPDLKTYLVNKGISIREI